MTATAAQPRPTARQAERLWREYRESGDVRVRNQLVTMYAPMVRYIVYKKVRELPARCEVEDFLSCGLEALIASVDRYDPAKGATLEQYAWTRVNGAVLDELRRQDWAPRSVRRFERAAAGAGDRFQAVHGRRPTEAELAELLEVTPAQLRGKRQELAAADVTSLNAVVRSADEQGSVERLDTIADTGDEHDPEHRVTVSEAKARFRAAFDALPERDREIAVLLYVHNLTLREIGDRLGVTESRVCQIHSQLKRRLKGELADDAELLSAVG